jgi:hypothetical protein
MVSSGGKFRFAAPIKVEYAAAQIRPNNPDHGL